MKEIEFSPQFLKKLKLLRKKNKKLLKKIENQLSRFENNPAHPSLRKHKLKGNLQDIWSISIDSNHRVVYEENDVFYFFDLGTHDEVYKK